MTSLDRCVSQIDQAAFMINSTVVERINEAFDELEASYGRPSERIVALEQVLHTFGERRPSLMRTPFGRLVSKSVDLRQNSLTLGQGRRSQG